MNIYRYLPYVLIPISLVVYEIATFFVMLVYPFNSILVSRYEPQNAFIAMFWYDGIGNIMFFIGVSLLIIPMLLYLSLQQKYLRVLFFIFASFILSYYAIFYWATNLATPYQSGYGQSGVAYAMFGLIIGMYISDAFLLLLRRRLYDIIVPIIVLIPLVLLMYVLPVMFYSETLGVLYIIHRIAFEYGIISGIVFSVFEGSFSILLGGSLYEKTVSV